MVLFIRSRIKVPFAKKKKKKVGGFINEKVKEWKKKKKSRLRSVDNGKNLVLFLFLAVESLKKHCCFYK